MLSVPDSRLHDRPSPKFRIGRRFLLMPLRDGGLDAPSVLIFAVVEELLPCPSFWLIAVDRVSFATVLVCIVEIAEFPVMFRVSRHKYRIKVEYIQENRVRDLTCLLASLMQTLRQWVSWLSLADVSLGGTLFYRLHHLHPNPF